MAKAFMTAAESTAHSEAAASAKATATSSAEATAASSTEAAAVPKSARWRRYHGRSTGDMRYSCDRHRM